MTWCVGCSGSQGKRGFRRGPVRHQVSPGHSGAEHISLAEWGSLAYTSRRVWNGLSHSCLWGEYQSMPQS